MEWKTAITSVEPNRIRIRGYPVERMMGRVTFGQMIYLVLRGDLPEPDVSEIVEAVLVSSIDHGATPVSCLAARNIATGGAPLNAAVAGGILAISRSHGGAIEACLTAIESGLERARAQGLDTAGAATVTVTSWRAAGRRIAGFGHRIHTEDPRTRRLLEMARERGLSTGHIDMAEAIGDAIEASIGRRLPMNVDGAIAAVLGGLGFSPPVANAFFLMARVPGLVAHAREETERYPPLRAIDPKGSLYDGPGERTP